MSVLMNLAAASCNEKLRKGPKPEILNAPESRSRGKWEV